jgi:hypothetical protein
MSNPKSPRTRQSESDRNILALSRASIDQSRQLLAKTRPQIDPHRLVPERASVSLIQVCDEWHVMVDEEGQTLVTRSFEAEHTAFIFATAERKRLGVDQVTRI